MKRASVYVLKNNIVCLSYSSDIESGIWNAALPFHKLPRIFDHALVLAIKDALMNSKENVTFESEYSANKLLKETTKLTFSKLQNISAQLVSLSDDGEVLKFIPNKIIGANKGFEPLNEKVITLSSWASEQDILSSLREAISRSES